MKPVNMSKDNLLNIIDHIRACIEVDDSFEGQLVYSMPEEDNAEHPFDVYACYRIGNSMGQGGMRVIGDEK